MEARVVGRRRVIALRRLAHRQQRRRGEIEDQVELGGPGRALEPDFPGQAIRADGTDEDVLRRVGTHEADWFFALTEGDNRNAFAAQLAAETFGVTNVVAKINDPVRAEAYTMLGLSTICRTRLLVDALSQYAGLPGDPGAAGVRMAEGHHAHHDGPAPALANER
jgi:voltage-gated potassium channel Kch